MSLLPVLIPTAVVVGAILGSLCAPKLASAEKTALADLKTILADIRTDALKEVSDLESARKTLLVIAARITAIRL